MMNVDDQQTSTELREWFEKAEQRVRRRIVQQAEAHWERDVLLVQQDRAQLARREHRTHRVHMLLGVRRQHYNKFAPIAVLLL